MSVVIFRLRSCPAGGDTYSRPFDTPVNVLEGQIIKVSVSCVGSYFCLEVLF